MKKRAKQLAMLGLTVTMMCGTQMTAFASGLGEEAPVAIETEAKATANEETEEVKVEAKEEKADAKEEVKTEVKEEVVTGTEVAETPVVEETEVKETVAGTEELVGLGVSTEAEAETEAPAEETEAETDADTDTVPTPAPQADVEANADTTIEAEADEVKDVQGELTGIDFTTAEGGVVTVTDADFNSGVVAIPYVLHGTPYDGGLDNGIYFDVISSGDFGIDNPQDLDGNGNYEGAFYAHKDALVAEGGTKTYSGTFKMMDTEAGGVDDTLDFSVTVKYVADGTVTPEPEKPQPDGGNGGTETPDPEKDGWIKTEEGWKYYENGQKATGWKAVSENWYYFNEDGIMATGWVSVGSHWYYLNADGSMATGWASVGGHWYYLNTDGSMATGWASVGGHWYYLNTDGSMATGWVSVGGHWYYLNTDGSMASSQWIDGWYVDASGKML